ncbi:SIMPL domain-containing protein [Candidatus Woesearchaeota archaeon]|jgi:uncharacterized protein|nr:SIMPL domain-containing protein [Candidatus Woesearchaeota archaeon]MBT6519524.1 SIMPL domain-containing protein [Candidatus Woesearchaeota archaeon]MBT7367731.1 SIMPL domain-containing protein [Candidatus Woesearchaeota archaeon]
MKKSENKNNFMNCCHGISFVVIIGLIIAVLVLSFSNASSSNIDLGKITLDQETNVISVLGNGEVTVDPDEATIYVEIEVLKDTASEAQESAAKIASDVIAALKKAGIKEDNIETDYYNLYPKTEWNQDTRKSEFVGYEVSNSLKVKTTDVDNVGKYLDVAVNAGANRVNRISFGLSKSLELEINDLALNKAAQSATEKAESISSALGVSLGKISKVSESNVNYIAYDYYPKSAGIEMAMDESFESTPINAEKLEITARISVEYEIVQ